MRWTGRRSRTGRVGGRTHAGQVSATASTLVRGVRSRRMATVAGARDYTAPRRATTTASSMLSARSFRSVPATAAPAPVTNPKTRKTHRFKPGAIRPRGDPTVGMTSR